MYITYKNMKNIQSKASLYSKQIFTFFWNEVTYEKILVYVLYLFFHDESPHPVLYYQLHCTCIISHFASNVVLQNVIIYTHLTIEKLGEMGLNVRKIVEVSESR